MRRLETASGFKLHFHYKISQSIFFAVWRFFHYPILSVKYALNFNLITNYMQWGKLFTKFEYIFWLIQPVGKLVIEKTRVKRHSNLWKKLP